LTSSGRIHTKTTLLCYLSMLSFEYQLCAEANLSFEVADEISWCGYGDESTVTLLIKVATDNKFTDGSQIYNWVKNQDCWVGEDSKGTMKKLANKFSLH